MHNIYQIKKQQGFTLIELMIAIVILSLVAFASYEALFYNSVVTSKFSEQAKYLTRLQQFVLIVDRDFAQISNNKITLNNNELKFESIQNDQILSIKYTFDDSIKRISSRKQRNNFQTKEFEHILIENISSPNVRVLPSNTNKLIDNWDVSKGGYLKAVEIKFIHSVYGEITKLALITE